MGAGKLALIIGAFIGLVLLVVGALVFAPPLFVPDGRLITSDRIKLVAEASMRSTILQFVAGIVVVLGIAYTAAQFRISQETHFTDRYTKAIDQLGHSATIVRMGAIFALKRLASNSAVDRPVVIDVLSGYLKAHGSRQSSLQTPPPPTRIPPDLQTALTVLIELHANAA